METPSADKNPSKTMIKRLNTRWESEPEPGSARRWPNFWPHSLGALVFACLLALLIPPRGDAHVVTKGMCAGYARQHLSGEARVLAGHRGTKPVKVYFGCRDWARRHACTHRVDRCIVLPAILLRVRRCESGGNYRAQNKVTTASGAYQYLDSTWGGHMGYRKARHAPRWVQDRRAIRDWRLGYLVSHWAASRHCWG